MSEPIFSMGTMQEEMAKSPNWVPIAENLYDLQVIDVVNEMRPSYNDKNVEQEALIVSFKVLKAADGSDPVDIEGNYPEKTTLSVWLNPNAVGFNTKTNEAHKARKVLTAIMGVAEEASLELQSWDDLLNRKVRAYVAVRVNAEGKKTNKLDNFSAILARPAPKTQRPLASPPKIATPPPAEKKTIEQ